jgi:kinase
MNERNEVDQVIDQSIDLKYKENICLVVKVGLYCTRSLPDDRPSMRTVVRMLLDTEPSH